MVLSLMHLAFYYQYCIYQNKHTLISVYDSVQDQIEKNGKLQYTDLEQFENNYGLTIIVLNEDFQYLYGITISDRGNTEDLDNYAVRVYGGAIEQYSDKMESQGYVTFIEGDSQYLYLIGELTGGDYLVLRLPIPAIEANIQYSRFFFLLTGLITMVLVLIADVFIARSFSNPIKEITQITTSIANMDFSKKYDGSYNGEIDTLGHNVNFLSETLEETIKDLQATNESLKAELKNKEQIDEMRQNLLANVSHDLKTPIAIIQGYAEGLKANISENPEDRDFYTDVIIEEADRMNKLVKQILNLSRLEMGQRQPELENIEITTFIDDVIKNYNMLVEDKQLTVINDVPQTIVTADVDMLGQVVYNLTTNAYDHTPESGKIIFTGEYRENKIRIKVFNEGKPIPEDDLEKIWLSFYKTDKSRTRTYSGTGLGLTIVKTIIESHGCECGVTNEENGVTFWFDLNIG
jgi:signal transduction histidine kinase